MQIQVLDQNNKIPNEWIVPNRPTYFIQGNNLFKLVNNPLFSYVAVTDKTKADEIVSSLGFKSHYDPSNVYLEQNNLDGITISRDELALAMRLFTETHAKHNSECAVILLLNTETNQIKVLPTLMRNVSHGSVTYLFPNSHRDISTLPNNFREKAQEILDEYDSLIDNGYILCGTIHSHSSFGAFHSGVDDNDEIHFDGVHITIGNVNTKYSYSSRIMAGGAEIKIDLEDLLEEGETLKKIEKYARSMPFDKELVNKLVIPRPTVTHKPKAKATVPSGTKWYHQIGPFANLFENKDPWDNNDKDPKDEILEIDSDFMQNYIQSEFQEEYQNSVFDQNDMMMLVHKTNEEILFVKYEFYLEHHNDFLKEYVPISDFDADELRDREEDFEDDDDE